MKKIFIIIIATLLSLSLFGQNKFNYEIQAKGGLSIGNGQVKIDSIVKFGNTIKFFSLGVELSVGSSSGGSSSGDFGEANITTTGTTTTGSLQVGDPDSHTIATIDSIPTDGTTFSIYSGGTQLAPNIPSSGAGELSDYVPLLVDTTLYFAPCIGVGNDGDTAAFTLNNVIWGAKWEGDHSFVITKVTGVVYGTTPDIDVALLYDTNFRDGTPTEVFSSDLTVTSTTTGDEATISGNNTIASGTWIWLRVDEATAKPEQLIINIYGYLE